MAAADFMCEREISLPDCFTLSQGEELIPGGYLRRDGKGAGRGVGEEALRRRDPVPGGPRAQPTGMTAVTWKELPWGAACAVKLIVEALARRLRTVCGFKRLPWDRVQADTSGVRGRGLNLS